MRKNTGKVLSMILAMAMVVSSFSATFVSASTQEVVGNDARVDTDRATDEYNVISDTEEDIVLISDLDGAYQVQTLDREDLDDVEYVSFSKVSGDSLVKVVRDDNDDDQRNLVLKKGASGTETIRINYKGTYTDDETDREVTARGSIEVDITAYEEGEIVLAKYEDTAITGDHPSDIELGAVNDSGMNIALYMATIGDESAETGSNAKWDIVTPYQQDEDDMDADEYAYNGGYFELSSDKNFVTEGEGDITGLTTDGYIHLEFAKNDSEGANDYAKVSTTRIELYAPKVSTEDGTPDTDQNSKGDKIRATVGVEKKYRISQDSYVDKLGARTLIGLDGLSIDFDSDDKYKDYEDDTKIITGYDIVVDSGNLVVRGGTLGAIDAGSADAGYSPSVRVENATINGNIDVDGSAEVEGSITLGEGAVVNGTLKNAETIDLEDGASVDSVDAGNATLTMNGASVSGNVKVETFNADDNDEYNNSVGGDIKADIFNIEASDGSFTADGALIATAEDAEYEFIGSNIAIGSIDGDYYPTVVTFDEVDMSLAVTNMNSFDTTLNLTNESDVTINGSARLGSIEVEEDSILRFAADATVGDISGDGMVVANAGQFHIKSAIADVALKLNGLAVGSTAFTADTDAVDESDFNGVGYSLTKEAASSTVDRFVVDAVSFAGLAFDKETVTIAQGYSDTITLAAYPTGTNAPADARVMWELDGNDDYFNVVVDPNTNVATINVTGYNADDKTANTATIRAYLVDEDGFELEDYVAATCKVTAVAQPEVRGTLKADTTSYTLPVGGIYDIQFSVTGVDATPVVTDSRTGSVFQLTNLGGNKYRVTGVNEGTAYVVATVGDTRVSVAITVDNDATQGGEKGNNVSEIR